MTQTIAEFLKDNARAGDRVYDNGVEYCVRKETIDVDPTLYPTDFIHEVLWGDRLDRSLKQPSVWRRGCFVNRTECGKDFRDESWYRVATYEPVRERYTKELLEECIDRYSAELKKLAGL